MKRVFLSLGLLLGVLAGLLPGSPARATVLTDSDNRVISFEQPFRRIISLYPAHTENLIHLGLDKEIIALSRGDHQLSERPVINFRDDTERLLALKPDLVLIRPMISRAYPDLIERLEENGVTVVSLQPTQSSEMFAYWTMLGELTGRREEANKMIADFGRELATLAAQVAAIPQEQRKRVYFEAIHSKMKTFAPTSIAIYTLESAGGINVATDALQLRNTNIAEYGKERILAKAEKIDVFLAQEGRMNQITAAEITNEVGFQVIKAVRENQVYLIEEELVSRPTPNLIKGMNRIFNILYADRLQETAPNGN